MTWLPFALLFPLVVAALPAADPPPAPSFELGQVAGAYSAERGHGFEFGTGADDRPWLFSIKVPEGNYAVTLELGSAAAGSVLTVKAESRRLMVERRVASAGQSPHLSFVVNVRRPDLRPPERNAPGGDRVVLNDREQGSFTWDEKLTLEVHAPRGAVTRISVSPVDVPTIYLAGDSTVTDQRFEDGASWGQMLPRMFGPAVAVANHAESGETLKSFVSGLRLAKVLERMRPGDWAFIQFGHNDQKRQWPQTYAEAGSTYDAWLKVFIAEVRLRGATPVLVTPPQRRSFDAAGRIRNSLGEYPAAVRRVAAEQQVALLDLERTSVALYEALGPERAPQLFADNGRDATHHNNLGAYLLAQGMAHAIRDARLPLAAHLVADLPVLDPTTSPDTFALPPSPRRSAQRPRGN